MSVKVLVLWMKLWVIVFEVGLELLMGISQV